MTLSKNLGLMLVLVVVAISFGALVEVVPQFFLKETSEPIAELKPLPAVALEGRDIYIREGCHVCHTQMVRPLRAEVERYGHYSVAGESVYEHPFLWGSKRTGPDLARVAKRYSDNWRRAHLYNPRNVVPNSNMPSFTRLFDSTLDGKDTAAKVHALSLVGVPHTEADMAGAKEAVGGRERN
jgi:cytochrome c oxidase cbb3-type subunit 2